jgi:hypothetical protein
MDWELVEGVIAGLIGSAGIGGLVGSALSVTRRGRLERRLTKSLDLRARLDEQGRSTRAIDRQIDEDTAQLAACSLLKPGILAEPFRYIVMTLFAVAALVLLTVTLYSAVGLESERQTTIVSIAWGDHRIGTVSYLLSIVVLALWGAWMLVREGDAVRRYFVALVLAGQPPESAAAFVSGGRRHRRRSRAKIVATNDRVRAVVERFEPGPEDR